MNLINESKYSAALQFYLGYNKEEADFVACNYNLKAKLGLVELLLCYSEIMNEDKKEEKPNNQNPPQPMLSNFDKQQQQMKTMNK